MERSIKHKKTNMNTIDLSKADIGDYFIREDHVVVQFTGVVKEINGVKYYKMRVGDYTHSYKQDGNIDALDMPDSFYKEKHLVRQVSESEVEMIKHAEDIERKRRQEVIALAEKLVVNEEMMKAHRGLFEAEVHARSKAPTSYSAFVIRSAEEFVKCKEKYLNAGNV